MNANISILDGSTFLVSSPNGDIDAGPDQPHGFFYKDMRHLSKWKLTIKGTPLDVLSTDTIEYYSGQHFCVPPTGTIYKNPTIGTLSVENIPGRWGRANVVAKGDDKRMMSIKEIYDQVLTARTELGMEELAA